MSYIVTGVTGIVGSYLVHTLNEAEIYDVIVVNNMTQKDKWMNLRNKRYTEYILKPMFLDRLSGIKNVGAITHMAACSSTTERDFDYLWNNNFKFTKALWNYCAENNVPFIYASSAVTHGDGSRNIADNGNIGS